MSMLTPPGMRGKKYRITGDRYPRMRRPRRRLRVLLALAASVALLGLLGYGALQLVDVFSGKDDRRDQAADSEEQACEPADATPVVLPEPEAITVNVYNSTDRSGLAQQTADALAERGFTIGEVDNAPEELDGQVEASGLLLGSAQAAENQALAVLSAHLPGTDSDTVDRDDQVVDLVIGEGFEQLTEETEVTDNLAALAAPVDECATGTAGAPGESESEEDGGAES